ncbi:hypothetical protein B0A55_07538 [Friedmanniomyces simplex]|uniref:Cytochrome b561 domain-containing protein n=1 Tax=Friedmanniomyces simplex TaxID=329884 RepID=A0A4U0WYT0_9PEZI|nr:hypothetical protein B0A55_07538 [Friedmanniomyces simplex]
MLDFRKAGLLLACASSALAQGYGGNNGGGGGSNPYSNGGGADSNGGSNNPFSGGNNAFFSQFNIMITAHAVLATLAFGLLFPVGGIIIRLASFPGLWWVHGLFQTFAYVLYIAAFAIGVYIANNMQLLDQAHPIIGIVLFVVLLFQPVLGFLHHTMFKKHSRRVVWSYGHIWLGRAAITLGIINGGLGLQLSQQTHIFAPKQGTIIAYGVVAGLIWLVYIASAIYGETKRRRSSAKGEINTPPGYQRASEEEMRQYA